MDRAAYCAHSHSPRVSTITIDGFSGPSFTIFSSFTGGADALVMAKHMIEKGHIRTAIIGGCNLVQRPNLSLQLKGLGVLTDGLATRSFSDDGMLLLFIDIVPRQH